MPWSILIGLGIVAAVVLVVYELKHRKAGAPPTGKDLVATVAAGVTPSLDQLRTEVTAALANVPGMISDEIAQLRGALSEALKRAEAAEAGWEAEKQATGARLAAVQAQVGTVIAGIGAQPAAYINAGQANAIPPTSEAPATDPAPTETIVEGG